jgi:enoyl-CoA hydratase/carnithine racemase
MVVANTADTAKVKTRLDGVVRTVTLNRPEKRNALDREMLGALEAAFSPPAAEERLAVIRAVGSVFCAGLDLKERSERPQGTSPIEAMLHAIEHYPLPVVAVVQGDAIAGGNELALHCDLVIASTTARFGMSLAQIGLAPSWFLAKKLLEVAGPVTTRRILLLGDPLPAQRLYDLGIVSHIADPEDLEDVAEAVVARLADNAPLSVRAMKALLLREMAFRDSIAHADLDRLVEEVRASQDAREGMAARLGRRKPSFTGR